jgi:hypothetical protein
MRGGSLAVVRLRCDVELHLTAQHVELPDAPLYRLGWTRADGVALIDRRGAGVRHQHRQYLR